MKKIFVSILFLILASAVVLANSDKKTKIELEELPKVVLDAAKEKVKGLEAKSASVKTEKDGKVYEINGLANGKNVTIEV